MSGHSKWSQIKRQKAVTDSAKSRVFSRYARLIALESKKANGILSAPGLSVVIVRAKAANMPKENIERAIAKGTSKDAGELFQVVYYTRRTGPAASQYSSRRLLIIKTARRRKSSTCSCSRASNSPRRARRAGHLPRLARIMFPMNHSLRLRVKTKRSSARPLRRSTSMRTSSRCSPMRVAMRILAIDPGYDRLGIAVVEGDPSRPTLLMSDCVEPEKGAREDRLAEVASAVTDAIKKYAPDALALETLFFSINKKTAIGVAEARGAILAAAGIASVPVIECSPQQVKLAVTGYGGSDKAAVATMIPRLLALPEKKRLDDELDAIAIGITALASGLIRH